VGWGQRSFFFNFSLIFLSRLGSCESWFISHQVLCRQALRDFKLERGRPFVREALLQKGTGGLFQKLRAGLGGGGGGVKKRPTKKGKAGGAGEGRGGGRKRGPEGPWGIGG